MKKRTKAITAKIVDSIDKPVKSVSVTAGDDNKIICNFT